jgi:hypothetical protein
MTEFLYVLNLALTFAVFCAVVMRLMATARPSPTPACIAHWLAWGAVHIGIAIGVLGIFFHNLEFGEVSTWYLLVLRISLAAYFLLERRRPTYSPGPVLHGFPHPGETS